MSTATETEAAEQGRQAASAWLADQIQRPPLNPHMTADMLRGKARLSVEALAWAAAYSAEVFSRIGYPTDSAASD